MRRPSGAGGSSDQGGRTISTFTPAAVAAEHLSELREVWRSVDEAPGLVAACTLAAGSASRILRAPLAIFGRSAAGWDLIVGADVPDAAVRLPDADALRGVLMPVGAGVVALEAGGPITIWTRVPLGAPNDPDWLMLLPGDWTTWPADSWLRLFAQDLHRALRLAAMKDAIHQRDGSIVTAYALARRLTRVRGQAMHQLLVDAVAHALGTEQASLAVYQPREHALAITATRGYPRALVDGLRIRPGAGVIGTVFASKKPILQGAARSQPRGRYRTPSFLSVPIMAHGSVVGVLSTTDASDRRRLTREDLALVRRLCALAAGAIASDLLRAECERLERAATIDPLTGTYNRAHFESRLDEEVARASRYKSDLALLMMDLDHFKTVNDTAGHAAGDAVLRTFAGIMQRSVRTFDVCARIGGDEFAMLMPRTSGDNARQSAERLCARVAAHGIGPADSAIRVSVSVGITTWKDGDSTKELLGRADRALYAAKDGGRSRVVLGDS